MSGYDPTTDPHYVPSEVDIEQAIDGEIEKITRELAELAALKQMFATDGWALLADQLTDQANIAARDLVTFRRGREAADFAYVQGQISKVEALLDQPRIVQSRYDELSLELNALQNPEPALA